MGLLDLLFGKKAEPNHNNDNNQPKRPTKTYDVEFKAEHALTNTIGLNDEQIVDYFREILQTEFPEYTIRENMAVTELVGNIAEEMKLYKTRPYQEYKAEWGQPYNFVMYRDGIVKGVVMLGDRYSHGQRVKYLIARKYAQKVCVPYIGFYTQMPNEAGYVVMRINEFLKA